MERKFAIAGLLAVTMLTGGCVQAVTGGTISFEATPANVDGQTLQSTGYELNEKRSVDVERTAQLPVVGERKVRITNHVRVYSRADVKGKNASENAVGAFFLVSTPQAKVLGKPVNPLGQVSPRQLVDRVVAESGQYGDLEPAGQRQLTVLGSTTTVAKFETAVEAKGKSVASWVYVTRVQHGGDYVIAVAVLPKVFADEQGGIYDMMENVDHEG